MYLVEEHMINKNHSLWKECDRLCYASKNLYNHALYVVKKEYKESGRLIPYLELYHLLKGTEAFKSIPNDLSKQVLKQVQSGWVFFFRALRFAKKNQTVLPNPPNFKDKLKGRNVVTMSNTTCRYKDGYILFNKHLNLKIKTKVSNVVEAKIVPQSSCYKIQICYKQEVVPYTDTQNKIAIDLGINNLCAISNNFNNIPLLINGKGIKSINKYFNKLCSNEQSRLKQEHKTSRSKYLVQLREKRQNKIKFILHNISKQIIVFCSKHNISEIIIGYNKEWKKGIDLGAKTNQTFFQIPYITLMNQIKYKAQLHGISVTLNEESYTSKCSALDLEEIKKHDEYKGKRIKRGLFKTEKGILVNADVNGSLNIGRKVFGNDFINLSNIGCVTQPVKVNPLQKFNYVIV